RAALEPTELGHEPPVVEQLDLPAVQERKEVAIEIGLRLLRELVLDTVRAERLTDELPAPPVARHRGDVIRLQQLREPGNGRLGAERGTLLSDRIEDRAAVLVAVRDG